MVKLVIGLLLALCIGAACRYFDVPVPAPPKLFGALLVIALTLGYLSADWALSRDASPPATQTDNSGGPTGETIAGRTDSTR
jgi:XapX domain-containing protein